MSATLVLTEALPAPGMRVLAARGDVAVRVLPEPTASALRAALPAADGVVMVMERPSLGADLIECAPRLRVACRMGAWDHPLFAFDNVVLTPHTAAYIATAFDRMAVATAENALAGLDGRLDRNVVVNAEVLGNH